MSGKILLIGKDSSFGQGFFKALAESPYEIITTNALDDTFFSGGKNEVVHLLIFADSHSSDEWTLTKNILEQHPWLPAIVVTVNDSSIEKDFQTHVHRSLARPLTQIGKFMTKVSDLVSLGKRFLEKNDQPEQLVDFERFAHFFDKYEYVEMVRSCFSYFSNLANFTNIVWVPEKALEKLKKRPESVLNKTGMITAESIMSYLPGGEQSAFNYLRILEKGFRQPVCMFDLDSRPILFPIWDNAADKAAGHFVFEGFSGQNIDAFVRQMSFEQPALEFFLRFARHHQQAVDQSFMDDLTELYNQRYLRIVLDQEMARASRSKEKFSVLFLDVDFFKKVNDTRGHVVGSKLLCQLADILKDCIRTNDFAFRYGGDEFVVVAIDADLDGAEVIAERIRQVVERTAFKVDGDELSMTVSIGVATFPDHAKNREDIIRMADEAMYCAKNKQRNIVYKAS